MSRWTRCTECPQSTRKRYAKFCAACRWRHRLKRKKYDWTDEKDTYLRTAYDSRIRGRSQQIAALWGWPAWVVRRRASSLGLARPTWNDVRRVWTPAEEAALERYAGVRHPNWIRQKLGRSLTSVVVKMKRLRLSRLPDGFAELDVAEAFGVERGTVERWRRLGWLSVSHPRVAGQPFRITDADLLAFIREHRQAFDLRKVDQVWFLDLVLGGVLAAKAEAA